MSATQFLTVDEFATELGISPGTIYGWRHRKYGPPAHKIGGQVRYRRTDIDEWIDSTLED